MNYFVKYKMRFMSFNHIIIHCTTDSIKENSALIIAQKLIYKGLYLKIFSTLI